MPVLIFVLVIVIIKYLFDDKNIQKIKDILNEALSWFGYGSNENHTTNTLSHRSSKRVSDIDAGQVVAEVFQKASASQVHELQKLTEKEISENLSTQLTKYSALKPYSSEISVLSSKIAAAVKSNKYVS